MMIKSSILAGFKSEINKGQKREKENLKLILLHKREKDRDMRH